MWKLWNWKQQNKKVLKKKCWCIDCWIACREFRIILLNHEYARVNWMCQICAAGECHSFLEVKKWNLVWWLQSPTESNLYGDSDFKFTTMEYVSGEYKTSLYLCGLLTAEDCNLDQRLWSYKVFETNNCDFKLSDSLLMFFSPNPLDTFKTMKNSKVFHRN